MYCKEMCQFAIIITTQFRLSFHTVADVHHLQVIVVVVIMCAMGEEFEGRLMIITCLCKLFVYGCNYSLTFQTKTIFVLTSSTMTKNECTCKEMCQFAIIITTQFRLSFHTVADVHHRQVIVVVIIVCAMGEEFEGRLMIITWLCKLVPSSSSWQDLKDHMRKKSKKCLLC
ncbi:uncharacterized protein [Primulina huaijiensis]|uniref:uncharacterized protein isoform X2 n=1 Tax=Primulina huaijiensis TaxID=1492673 RepID=UPI003CC77AD2